MQTRPLPEPPRLAFTPGESDLAFKQWGANCGPHAAAAILGVSLDAAKDLFPDFWRMGVTSPQMMAEAISLAKRTCLRSGGLKTVTLPTRGVALIQWVGPWLEPGAPEKLAWRHSHWVASSMGHVFCTATPFREWLPETRWRAWIADNQPPWYATHHYTVL